MSHSEDLDNLPELYDDVVSGDEEVINVHQETKAAKPKAKKALTAKQLESAMLNLQKAKQSKKKKAEQRKQQEDEYDTYEIPQARPARLAPRQSRREPEPEDDYSDAYSDEDNYEPEPKRQSSKQTGKKPTKTEVKRQNRLDKMEELLFKLMKTQKSARSRPVSQTIVQIPKAESKSKVVLPRVLRMFDD
jgi:hypothetical protein